MVVNPLNRLRSIKVKLSIVIVAAVAVTLAVNEVGIVLNFRAQFRAGVAALLALGMVQILSRGMTSPLRSMERAATSMAAGNVGERIEVSSADEVGRLADAFNHMAQELAEVDRQRRELVANVSHELRTPISALRATLENVVDGVVSVPAAADIRQLRLRLADFGNFRELAILRKIVVDDNRTYLVRESDMALFIKLLIAKHHKTACRPRNARVDGFGGEGVALKSRSCFYAIGWANG